MSEPIILFEDSEVLALYKPRGWLVHADGKHADPTIVDWLLRLYPHVQGVGERQTLSTGEVVERSGIVHRLDKETTGVLLIAKTQNAYDKLKQSFLHREIKKEYRAIVYGYMKSIKGIIERPIGRSSRDPRVRSAMRGSVGVKRDAVTEWELISQNASFAYIRAFPKTGRTHQIRVHMKFIEHPIVGDELYATKNNRQQDPLQNQQLMLHAYAVTFMHPIDNSEIRVVAELPAEFKNTLESIAIPEHLW